VVTRNGVDLEEKCEILLNFPDIFSYNSIYLHALSTYNQYIL
jgi:hypothetical protein